MPNLNQRNPRVNTDQFSMVPRADIPRSTFFQPSAHKTTFQGGNLVPVLVKEILPGDSIRGQMTIFARMNTLLFPLMDHITLESFFFITPIRIVWPNFKKMMGEQANPADSISYILPTTTTPAGGYPVCSLQDYMGLPVVGQMGGGATKEHNVLPLRCYNLIWNEWFRDQNLQDSLDVPTGDGPDLSTFFALKRRNKKHDYFTSALPWPLKGGVSVSMPLSGNAPVIGIGKTNQVFNPGPSPTVYESDLGSTTYSFYSTINNAENDNRYLIDGTDDTGGYPKIFADLSLATGATIAALRLAVQTQRLLERDARSGTRYTEHLHAHWGVTPEDARLQRPEYIGGGKSSVQTSAIPQTSATGLTGGTTPVGGLAGQATVTGQHTFQYQATEHAYLIGLVHVDAEQTYQQGIHRLWTRSTRFDFYIPVLAHLSEQAIRNDELYVTGITNTDSGTFGYQERWAEYRYEPSRVSGYFRSTSAGNIDEWHSAQQSLALPTLNTSFIQSNPPFSRNLAAGAGADNMQFLADMLFNIHITRAMPMRSVPGGMDRF